MSLSEFLQCNEVMQSTRSGDPQKLLDTVLRKGNEWYQQNPAEVASISSNLEIFGFPADTHAVANFQHHLLLHYFEKLLGLCLAPLQFKKFLENNVRIDESLEAIKASLSSGKAVLLANGHFGAVEYSTPALAAHKLPVNTVLRFKTEALAKTVSDRAQQLIQEADFGKINFIQIGRAGTSAALDMAAAIRRKEVLLSIFDEKTEYSKKVSLFGRTVWGGAGIDRIIRFSGTELDIYTIFTVRTSDNTYHLRLEKIEETDPVRLVQAIYTSLEKVVKNNPEQWYFLHEEIPFAE